MTISPAVTLLSVSDFHQEVLYTWTFSQVSIIFKYIPTTSPESILIEINLAHSLQDSIIIYISQALHQKVLLFKSIFTTLPGNTVT